MFGPGAFCCIFIKAFSPYMPRTALPFLTVVAGTISPISPLLSIGSLRYHRRISQEDAAEQAQIIAIKCPQFYGLDGGCMASWAGGSIARKRTNGHGLQARSLTATLTLDPFPEVLQQRHVFRGNPRSPVFNKQRRADIVQARPGQIWQQGPQPDPGTEFNQRHAEV